MAFEVRVPPVLRQDYYRIGIFVIASPHSIIALKMLLTQNFPFIHDFLGRSTRYLFFFTVIMGCYLSC